MLYTPNTYTSLALLSVLVAALLYGDARDRVANTLNREAQTASALVEQEDDIPIIDATAEEISVLDGEIVSAEDISYLEEEILTTLGTKEKVSPDNSQEVDVEVDAIAYAEIKGVGWSVNTDELDEESEGINLKDKGVNEILLPYAQNIFVEGEEWGGGYGTYTFTDNRLIIGGGDHDAASLILLQDTVHLKNYVFKTLLDWHHGSSLSLVARFYDYDNYVSCSYLTLGTRVSIISVENGERIVHGSSPSIPIRSYDPWKDIDFGIRAYGNTLECLVNGDVVLRDVIPTMSDTGTVGIALWAKNPGEALATLKSTQIEVHAEQSDT